MGLWTLDVGQSRKFRSAARSNMSWLAARSHLLNGPSLADAMYCLYCDFRASVAAGAAAL